MLATSAKALKQHEWAIHGAGNEPATCALCGVTKTLYWLCSHKPVCEGQPTIACSVCEGKTYKNKRSFLKHLKSATHIQRADIAARTPMVFIDYSRIPAPVPAFVHAPANVPPVAEQEQWSFEGGFDVDVGAFEFDAGVFAAPASVSATEAPLFADDAPMPARADDSDNDDDCIGDVNEPPPPPPSPPPSEPQVLDLSKGFEDERGANVGDKGVALPCNAPQPPAAGDSTSSPAPTALKRRRKRDAGASAADVPPRARRSLGPAVAHSPTPPTGAPLQPPAPFRKTSAPGGHLPPAGSAVRPPPPPPLPPLPLPPPSLFSQLAASAAAIARFSGDSSNVGVGLGSFQPGLGKSRPVSLSVALTCTPLKTFLASQLFEVQFWRSRGTNTRPAADDTRKKRASGGVGILSAYEKWIVERSPDPARPIQVNLACDVTSLISVNANDFAFGLALACALHRLSTSVPNGCPSHFLSLANGGDKAVLALLATVAASKSSAQASLAMCRSIIQWLKQCVGQAAAAHHGGDYVVTQVIPFLAVFADAAVAPAQHIAIFKRRAISRGKTSNLELWASEAESYCNLLHATMGELLFCVAADVDLAISMLRSSERDDDANATAHSQIVYLVWGAIAMLISGVGMFSTVR